MFSNLAHIIVCSVVILSTVAFQQITEVLDTLNSTNWPNWVTTRSSDGRECGFVCTTLGVCLYIIHINTDVFTAFVKAPHTTYHIPHY